MQKSRYPGDAIAIDLRVVGFRQPLSHYNLTDLQKKHLSAIIDVYIFDRNLNVHCAELTPSYEMHRLYTATHLTDDEELSDEVKDDLRYEIEHPSEFETVYYVHTNRVDRVIVEHDKLSKLVEQITDYRNDFDCDGDPIPLDNANRYLRGCMRRLLYVDDKRDYDVPPEEHPTKESYRDAIIEAAIEYYNGNPPI